MISLFKREKISYIFDYIVVAASIVLIVALTIEILNQDNGNNLSDWFIQLQLVICTIFLADFFVSLAASRRKRRYFWSHLPILILSVPYLSLPYEQIMDGNSEGELLIALTPIFRGIVAIYILLRWIIRGENALRLLFAYILTLLSFTYISALIFFECEHGMNPAIGSFGDALWWASMGLTTTELTITPISVTGRVLAVLLPLSGMMILPIATNYLLSLKDSNQKKEESSFVEPRQ